MHASSTAPIPAGVYELRVVPDTLDLAYRAELALNAITRSVNPRRDYDTYFRGNIIVNPPRISHTWESAQGKLSEPLLLNRLMTGNLANMDVDAAWIEWLHARRNGIEHLHPVYMGRSLCAIALHYRLTRDPAWLETGQRVVERLDTICPKIDDFAYIPAKYDLNYRPATQSGRRPDYMGVEHAKGWPARHSVYLLQGLCAFVRETGDAAASDLAGKLARFIRYHAEYFCEDGQFLARHEGYLGPKSAIHFYCHANGLLVLTEYTLVSGDRSFAEFARKGYEFARTHGAPEIGFFPEYLEWPQDRGGVINCEACDTAAMTGAALKLTEAGIGDYWEHVDCYVRNMLTECQLTSSRWIEESLSSVPETPIDPELDEIQQVPERLVGNFAAWASPNEFRVWNPGITQCCVANSSRALYFAWCRMLNEEPERVTVELLMNRASKSADVTSDLPYAGRVSIHMKKQACLRVRMPSWLNPRSLAITSRPSGETVAFNHDGPYATISQRTVGEELLLTFDLPERTTRMQVGHIEATVTLRGNEVVDFDPPGNIGPMWQGKPVHNGVSEIGRTYFIPNEVVRW